jgi:nucleoside 2-deoxyribosyltransferase
MFTVYLAGGMHDDWRLKVIDKARGFKYLDPSLGNSPLPEEYTTRDLLHVRASDIIFANLERDNPSGIGLALEVGYGKALGKVVILVNQQPKNRYMAIIEHTADVTYGKLDDGIDFLNKLKGEL